ncbi:hypothetical protein N2152v2_003941 [Parachlorella kessleri]
MLVIYAGEVVLLSSLIDAVAALKASLKPVATVKRDGKWQQTDAALLVPGDLVLLAAGAAVPADCVVNDGRIEVDQSALTGESLPVSMYKGDSAKMGSTVTRGEVESTVEFTGSQTFFGKTATLLQAVEGLGNLQKILLKIMFVLVAMSLLLCGTALIYLLARGENFKSALSFTIVLLVASIPIAIEIVCTTTLALGSRQLSVHGAIVTRLQAIEEMAGMNMLCSDKTGTLTMNKMAIQDHCPIFTIGEDRGSVLRAAALATKWKEPAKDALDTMVLGAADLASLEGYTMLDHQPFDPTIKRTESTLKGPDGKVFKVTKGAPHIIAKLVSNEHVREAMEGELGTRGIRSLAVARTLASDLDTWEVLGMLTFLDPPRPDTKHTIEQALENGVDVKMVTGDQVLIAKEMARMLGLGTNIPNADGLPKMDADGKIPSDLGEKYGHLILEADGFAQVYPEHKYLIVEALRQQGFAVGMTGDGVNDAPALKRADVGIAVSGATDAARAAADIVLTQPGLSVVIHAIVIARCIFQRVKNFINYRIAATLQLLIFFFISVFAFDPQQIYGPEAPSFFQLPVLMLMLITLLNDGTLISVGYDHVIPSPRPEKWNLKVLFLVSAVLGSVSMVTSILFLNCALKSNHPGSLFQKWGLPTMNYGQIVCSIYLKVSLSDFLTLFSARSNPGPFWSQRPGKHGAPESVICGKLLMSAALVALGLSTTLACIWPEGTLDDVPVEGLTKGDYKLWPLWIWIYCIIAWFIQASAAAFAQGAGLDSMGHWWGDVSSGSADALKVITYYFVYKFDIFKARTAALVNVREAHSPTDNKAAQEVTGRVEAKLVEHKVDNALSTLDRLQRVSATPSLARASANLALARVSAVSLRRTSLTAAPAGDLEANVAELEQVVGDMQQAADEVAGQVPEESRAELLEHIAMLLCTSTVVEIVVTLLSQSCAELLEHIAGVQRAVANLERVSAALGRTSATPGGNPKQ